MIVLRSVSDVDCGGFLQSLVINQLVPAILKQVVTGSIGVQAVGTILGGAGFASRKWFHGVGHDMAHASKSAMHKAIPHTWTSPHSNAGKQPEALAIDKEASSSGAGSGLPSPA